MQVLKNEAVRLGWLLPLIVALALILSAPALAQEATQEPSAEQSDMESADSGLSALIPPIIAGLVVVVGIAGFTLGKLNGTNNDPRTPDQYASERLELLRMNREAMAAQERAYQDASRAKQQAIDALSYGLRFLAPMTSWKTDDAAARYLEDLRTPGPPISEMFTPGGPPAPPPPPQP